MNSILMEMDQYSARVANEDQALMSRRGDQEQRKVEFFQRCLQDRKIYTDLSQSEKYIFGDKAIYMGKMKLEQRLQDIDEVFLPFDNIDLDEKERNEKMKELSKSSQSDNQRIDISKRNKQLQNFWLVLSPDSSLKLLWDFFCMILILYEIITIPIRISFDIEVSAEFGYVIILN